jgi:small-conductance mechanosensitive channel
MADWMIGWRFLWPGIVHVGVTLLALALRAVALTMLDRWLSRERPSLIVAAVRLPSILWCLVLGFYVGIGVADFPLPLIDKLNLTLLIAVLFSVTITVANLVSSVIVRASHQGSLHGQVSGLAQTSARISIFAVGLLVILSALGIQITPLLTALGVGGLAVALALQDTLSNLFAGIHLLADRPIRVGDYVKLSEGVEGFVTDVGWRSTRIRTLLSNIVVLPNQTVAKSTITNYDMPDSRVGHPMKIVVPFGADPVLVRRILFEEANAAVATAPGLVGDPAPAVWLMPGFGEYGMEFTVIVWMATFVDQYEGQTQIRTRILKRLRAEGIEIPVPIRTVRLEHLDGRPDGRFSPEGRDVASS